jgi:hypothetical protein
MPIRTKDVSISLLKLKEHIGGASAPRNRSSNATETLRHRAKKQPFALSPFGQYCCLRVSEDGLCASVSPWLVVAPLLRSNCWDGSFRKQLAFLKVANLAGKFGGVGIVSHHDDGFPLLLIELGEDRQHLIGRL